MEQDDPCASMRRKQRDITGKALFDAGSGDFVMEDCAGFSDNARKNWVFVVCDWLVNFILPLLSLFFAMFCYILFRLWFCPKLSWWLVAMNVFLIACMAAVAVMFAIGSREIGLKMKSSQQSKQ
ncbi:hypothetical protein [Burkholderia sp. SRS-W-2-2016]|uniref:hypothetical protein n=1 Tax=Burkholderia sp. SRS-W-2-2016 TaxID=1926878 RepID=UPI00117D725D|nr:hypothetical protein [Burkholderia sp. SRS-W-2-2016]